MEEHVNFSYQFRLIIHSRWLSYKPEWIIQIKGVPGTAVIPEKMLPCGAYEVHRISPWEYATKIISKRTTPIERSTSPFP